MHTIDGMPGTFINENTKKLNFIKHGELTIEGFVAEQWSARVFDGVLGLLVAREPAGENGSLAWHISLSHRHGWKHTGEEVYTRLPTWDELKFVKYKFCPPNVPMSIVLPAVGEPYVDDHPTCLHLWEIPRPCVAPEQSEMLGQLQGAPASAAEAIEAYELHLSGVDEKSAE